ncbi:MAG: EF-hand domain-containing protein [Candidatus Latescibacteria bacterium]|nr:EF-hand domain-containing protein [Candidatus Latescibacterota bacterium]
MIGGINSFSGLNSASMSQMRQSLFSSVDTDSDGSITKSELETFVVKNQPGVDEIFNNSDTDHDGVIGGSESDESMAMLDLQMMAGFSMKMSMLSGTELGQGSGAGMELPPPPPGLRQPPEITMDAVDSNGDGSIDEDELSAFLEENGLAAETDTIFSDIDTDGDGLISSSELEAANEKMKAKMQEDYFARFSSDDSQNSQNLQNTKSNIIEEILNSYYITSKSSTIGEIDLLS